MGSLWTRFSKYFCELLVNMQQEYELLSDSEDRKDVPSSSSTAESMHSRHVSLTLLVVVVCTMANLCLWWSFSSQSHPKVYLEEPTTYIGLDNLEFDMDVEANLSFHNFPLLLTQISKAEPERVWADDATRRLTSIGTISPDSRRFVITPEISSIAQFRVVDFGFENCTLHISLRSSFSGQTHMNETFIDIWALDEQERLQPKYLTWTSRPQRKELLQTVELKSNMSSSLHRSWNCGWGSLQAFEFACSQHASRCSVDFWQDPKNPELGVTMIQRSSLY